MKEYKYKINGADYTVNIESVNDDKATVTVNGVSYEVEMPAKPAAAKPVVKPAPKPAAAAAKPAAAPAATAAPAGAGAALKSPLPGVINDIKVAVGEAVKKGQIVLILEAMKMENEITAECDGTVTAICVNKGDSVMEGATLLTIG